MAKNESIALFQGCLPAALGVKGFSIFLSSGYYGPSNYFESSLLPPGPLLRPFPSSGVSLLIYRVVGFEGVRPKHPFQVQLIRPPHSAGMKAPRQTMPTPCPGVLHRGF